MNLRLEVGEISQEVTVVEETPMVNTTTSSVSGLVGEREVKDLPLNGRSFDNLITLNPGAINYGLKSANTSTSNGNTFSVAGRRPMDNLILLNGIEYTGSSQLAITPGGVSGDLLGIDAVREFNVQTDTYGAEYGKRAGAQVSVVTQSGTNALHGSLFEFLRNSALDSRSVFAQTSFVPPFRRTSSEARWAVRSRKTGCSCSAITKASGRRKHRAASALYPMRRCVSGIFQTPPGVYTPVANLNQAMLPYFSFWPQPNGTELLVKRAAERDGLFVQQSQAENPRRFRHRPIRLHHSRHGLTFGQLHD